MKWKHFGSPKPKKLELEKFLFKCFGHYIIILDYLNKEETITEEYYYLALLGKMCGKK